MWLLTTRSSSGQPQEYSLRPGNNTLGRSPENNIVVADRSASRAHAEIYFDADADTANRLKKRLEALGYQVTLEKQVVAMAV